MTSKQFEQIECLSKKLWGDINNGHEYSMVTYTEFLSIVTKVWEKMQEEPLSDDLEEASKNYALNNTPWDDCKDEIQESFKAGAKWGKNQAKAEIQAQSMALAHGCPKEPVSEELEYAADKFVKSYTKGGTKQSWLEEGYIAGAKWQEQKIQGGIKCISKFSME